MKTLMVRYETLLPHADENETLVRAVFESLRTSAPGGLRYTTYRLADGVTFVHIATLAAVDDNPLIALPAFKAFQAELKKRCAAPPTFTEAQIIGTFTSIGG